MVSQSKTVTLLDGGMGQELVRRSQNPATAMWSAGVMLHEPHIVRDLHTDYINAGARVITLNTYSVTPERLARDWDASQFESLQKTAIDIAVQARDDAGVEGVAIAGCLPPLVASYRAELSPDYDTSLQTYRQIVACQSAHVDLFIAETMASVSQARAAANAAVESGKPVWIALTVADDNTGKLRSGESLTEALQVLDEIGVHPKLLNCSKPEAISAGWAEFASNAGPLGAYANGFTSVDALGPGGIVDVLEARIDLGPEEYAAVALSWVEQGASIIGGCCEVGPAHINELERQLKSAGFEVAGLVR